MKRIFEEDRGEAITGMDEVRRYTEEARKAPAIRYRSFLKHIKALGKRGEYLEIGSGPGNVTALVAEQNPEVNIIAMDVSPDMVAVAGEYIGEKNLEDRVRFVVGDANDIEALEALGRFDLVYCSFTMHHWKDPVNVISNLLKVVAENGVLMIFDLKRVWSMYYVPVNNGMFKSIRASYRPREIRTILKKAGADNCEIIPVFPFFMHTIIVRK